MSRLGHCCDYQGQVGNVVDHAVTKHVNYDDFAVAMLTLWTTSSAVDRDSPAGALRRAHGRDQSHVSTEVQGDYPAG